MVSTMMMKLVPAQQRQPATGERRVRNAFGDTIISGDRWSSGRAANAARDRGSYRLSRPDPTH